jgi:protein TonB
MVSHFTSAKTTMALGAHASKPGWEPDLRIETRVVSEPQTGRRQARSGLWSVSLFLHAVLLLTVIAFPLITPEALPPLASVTKAFFVGPAVIGPAMPPPPRAAAAPQIRPRPPAEESRALTAPAETPDQVVPEADGDAIPGGSPGGVEGGVPGGIVGGVVGGLPDSPVPIQPLRLGGEIKEPMKLKHVAPIYPDIAVRANIQGSVILECTVSPRGQVTEVRVLRGIPLLNAAAVEAVKHWEYTPTLRDGIPVPVIFTVTVKFALE